MPATRHNLPMSLAIGLLALAFADFALTGGLLQWLRTDLDPIAMPLSAYLQGPGGAWLRGAYYLMAAALAGLAWSSYRITNVRLRSGLASALFVVAAVALPVVAVTVLDVSGPSAELAKFAHGMAAQTTFLCLLIGMLRLSWCWRHDSRMRRSALAGWLLAWLAFVQMWLLALWKQAPPGIMQKLLIALILAWLSWVTWQLKRAQEPE